MSRNSVRRKIALPVTITRSNGDQQLAQTLDVSESSARLGGLSMLLEPGEIVTVQHRELRARFQVFWMGSPQTSMEGQAGLRGLEPHNPIWGLDSPADQTESAQNPDGPATLPGDKRGYSRLECSGAAAVLSIGARFPMQGLIKDVSQGGIYVEITQPLAVGSKVSLKMSIEGMPLEATGVVRTSYPMVGMGISFQDMSQKDMENLDHVLDHVTFKNADRAVRPSEPAMPRPELQPSRPVPVLRLDAYPVRVLASACQTVAINFDEWKRTHSPEEVDELRQAVLELYRKLSSSAAPGDARSFVMSGSRRDTA
jgi:hypothetical protein